MSTREPVAPAVTVLDILARQAAEHREHARQRGIAATDAKAPLTDAAHAMTETRKQVEALERALATARQAHEAATARHAEALAAHAHHEAEAQQAADIAESLDRIAAQMRGQAEVPPAEALGATGLMPRPFMWGCQVGDRIALHWIDGKHDVGRVENIDGTVLRLESGEEAHAHLIERVDVLPEGVEPIPPGPRLQDNGLPMVWSDLCAPGGYVCAVYETAGGPGIDMPDGTRICGRPVESEPCGEHGPDDVAGDGTRVNDDHPPAVRRHEQAAAVPVVAPTPPRDPDQPGTVVAVSGPLTTMPDVGLNPRPLPPALPAEPTGRARHERPRGARWTGGFKLPHLGRDEQPHEQDGDTDA